MNTRPFPYQGSLDWLEAHPPCLVRHGFYVYGTHIEARDGVDFVGSLA